ncbi:MULTISPECIES: DUF5951 family protein [Kosakonia]|uniref:DUF5951 family protein n=1 Tax=Kosakonia TaxID=1330547 RepID=UPI00338DE4CC
MEAYLSGEKSFVKPHFSQGVLTAESIDNLSSLSSFSAEMLCRIRVSPPSFEM